MRDQALQEVIDRLNDLFSDAALTANQKQSFVEGLRDTLLGDPTLVGQARANTKKQFLESPNLMDCVLDAVEDNQGAHNQMADVFFTDTTGRADLVRLVGAMVYEWASDVQPAAGEILEVAAPHRMVPKMPGHGRDNETTHGSGGRESGEPAVPAPL